MALASLNTYAQSNVHSLPGIIIYTHRLAPCVQRPETYPKQVAIGVIFVPLSLHI